MATQPITLNLPDFIYERLKKRADEMNRSVEAELMEVVVAAVPIDSDLPADLEAAIAGLAFLDDKTLWRLARGRMNKKDANKIASLHLKEQREGLSESETQLLAELMQKLSKIFVMKTHALGLLVERGHDVSELAPKQ